MKSTSVLLLLKEKNGCLTPINPMTMQLNDYKNYLYKAARCGKKK
jgi:hypothetical protein